MTIKHRFGKDINGYISPLITPPSTTNFTFLLAAGVEQTFTVPSDYSRYVVYFSFTTASDVFVSVNNTAVTPTGAAAASNSRRNPFALEVNKGDVVHMISPSTTTYGSASIYGSTTI